MSNIKSNQWFLLTFYWERTIWKKPFSGNNNIASNDKETNAGHFIPYADSSYIGEPYFDYGDYEGGKGFDRNKETFRSDSGVVRSTIRNVTAQLGTTTYLHCKVNNLGGKTVRALIEIEHYVIV